MGVIQYVFVDDLCTDSFDTPVSVPEKYVKNLTQRANRIAMNMGMMYSGILLTSLYAL